MSSMRDQLVFLFGRPSAVKPTSEPVPMEDDKIDVVSQSDGQTGNSSTSATVENNNSDHRTSRNQIVAPGAETSKQIEVKSIQRKPVHQRLTLPGSNHTTSSNPNPKPSISSSNPNPKPSIKSRLGSRSPPMIQPKNTNTNKQKTFQRKRVVAPFSDDRPNLDDPFVRTKIEARAKRFSIKRPKDETVSTPMDVESPDIEGNVSKKSRTKISGPASDEDSDNDDDDDIEKEDLKEFDVDKMVSRTNRFEDLNTLRKRSKKFNEEVAPSLVKVRDAKLKNLRYDRFKKFDDDELQKKEKVETDSD